jgi:hypothetical protein
MFSQQQPQPVVIFVPVPTAGSNAYRRHWGKPVKPPPSRDPPYRPERDLARRFDPSRLRREVEELIRNGSREREAMLDHARAMLAAA